MWQWIVTIDLEIGDNIIWASDAVDTVEVSWRLGQRYVMMTRVMTSAECYVTQRHQSSSLEAWRLRVFHARTEHKTRRPLTSVEGVSQQEWTGPPGCLLPTSWAGWSAGQVGQAGGPTGPAGMSNA